MSEASTNSLKIDSLFNVNTSYCVLPSRISNPQIRLVAESLVRNLGRTTSLASALPLMVGLAIESQRFQCDACIDVVGIANPDTSTISVNDEARIVARVNELLEESRKTASLTEQVRKHWKLGIFLLDMALATNTYQVDDGVKSLLSSLVLTTWTAFETLAGDLWTAALNVHPQGLSSLTGTFKAWRQIDKPPASVQTEKAGDKDNVGKQISLGVLQKYKFNLSANMGDVLRDKQEFTTLAKIREAYANAFSDDYDRVREVLLDQSLDHLSSLRNVLVHKGGIADIEFKSKIAGCEYFKSISVGDEVLLDGKIVAEMISAVSIQASNLVLAVDQWIIRHPTKTN
ncbi:MAG: hypothetical protein QM775_06560 [Pirellulales bacterium]